MTSCDGIEVLIIISFTFDAGTQRKLRGPLLVYGCRLCSAHACIHQPGLYNDKYTHNAYTVHTCTLAYSTCTLHVHTVSCLHCGVFVSMCCMC